MGKVEAGQTVAVLGCGPIGLLIALVAKDKGASVLVSEPSAIRRKLAQDTGIGCVHPSELVEAVGEITEGRLADVVFEVSGAAAAAAAMTKVVRTRGTIVIVSIFAQPAAVDLRDFFAQELHMCGARVYEPRDFEEALEVAASGRLPLGQVISKVLPLEQIEDAFLAAESGSAMKVLLQVGKE
jgi:(R,R)-butanediol dehydrogenase/meso-butanediol dehydrogenase/diacetyl reductase